MLPINVLTGGLIVIHRPELSHLSPKLAGISARIEWMPALTTHRPQVGVCKTSYLSIAMASSYLLGRQFDHGAEGIALGAADEEADVDILAPLGAERLPAVSRWERRGGNQPAAVINAATTISARIMALSSRPWPWLGAVIAVHAANVGFIGFYDLAFAAKRAR
ncbi:hypothetical protein [Mesorhizobium sp. Cs1299R1N3]|uniref:hypothetical protein n=1 Tax=Mesorhizobium sp. Cs1299R1N3 TaxID=3015173 RepID=UPI00301C9640